MLDMSFIGGVMIEVNRRYPRTFQVIAGIVACVFLSQQISWAGDLIDTTLNKQYEEQSQTFAPAYIKSQQANNEALISQKQAIEDFSNQTASPSIQTQSSVNDSITLQGPKSGSGGQTMAVSSMNVTADEPETGETVLSVTTQAGDVIYYREGAIDHIEKKDGTVLRNIVVDENNNLLEAGITYIDGTTQVIANGKVSKITKPDGTIINYNSEELITSILYPDAAGVTFSYTKDEQGNILETALVDSEKTSIYGSDSKLKKVMFNNGKIIEYDSGVISKITEADNGQLLFDIKGNIDGTFTSTIAQYIAPDSTIYRYAVGEDGCLASIAVEKDGAVAAYDKDGDLLSVSKDGETVTAEAIAHAQADYDAAVGVYDQKKQYAEACQASLDSVYVDLVNAQAAKVASENGLSNGTAYVVSSYTSTADTLILNQYKNFINDQFNSYSSTIWHKPADSLVAIGSGIATLKGTGSNYNATFYTNQFYARTDKPILSTTFKVSSTSGKFIAALDGYTSSNSYRRVGIFVQSGKIYVQTVSDSTTGTPATLIGTAKTNTNYNLDFEVTPQEIKICLWESAAQRPTNPSYTYTVTDWNTVRPYFSLYSGTAAIDCVTLKSPSFTSTYDSNSQLVKDVYQNGNVSTYSYAADKITISDYKKYLDSAYSLLNTTLWYKPADSLVTLNNGIATLKGTGINYNATFYANQSFARSDNVVIRSDFQTSSTSGKFIAALDGYTSSGAYRRIGIIAQSGKIYVQTVSGGNTSTPATLIGAAKANTNYTVEFQATAQGIKIYLWESSAQRPANPSYTYAVTDWASVRPYFSLCSGTATVRNVYINYIPQIRAVSAGYSEWSQILAHSQSVKNLKNAIDGTAAAQAAYDQAGTVFNKAKSEKDAAKANVDCVLAALDKFLSVSSIFQQQDIVLQNADSKLETVSVLYDAERRVKQVHKMDGDIQNYTAGLLSDITGNSDSALYSYDLSALDNISGITIDRDGIKRIYDQYGNLQSISLSDATQIVYENGQVKEIDKADGTKIKNMTFTDTGDLDSALISYPDGSVAIYDDSKLLQLISVSGDVTDYADGKIRKITLEDGTSYDWSYNGSYITILDNSRQEERKYSEGSLIELEELTGAKLTTKYYYDSVSKNLIKSEISQNSEILYTYTYTYEDGLTLIHDEDGNTQAYTKDKRLAYIIDSKGRQYSYTYVGKSEGYIEVYFPSGAKARYDSNGNIIDITESDGAVIKDIVFDQNNIPQSFTYIKDVKTYKVIGGKISEAVSQDGTDTLYYENGFVKSIQTQIANNIESYQYYVSDAKIYENVSVLQSGTVNNLSYYINNATAYLGLSNNSLEFGNGIDGIKHVTADETLPVGAYNFTSLTIDSGETLTITPNTTIKVLGTANIKGHILCSGSFNIYANNVNVTSSGTITGAVAIKCNTINNSGTITGNACLFGSLISGPEAMRDNDFDTIAQAAHFNADPDRNVPKTSEIDFPSCDISKIVWKVGGWASQYDAWADVSTIIYLKVAGSWVTVKSYYAHSPGGYGWTIEELATGWQNVTGMKMYSYGQGYDTSSSVAYHYEMQAIIGTPTIEYINGNIGSFDPASAHKKQYSYPSSGTFTSDVIQMDAIELDKVSWSEDLPRGTDITFQTRTGNVPTPDSTWTDWSSPLTDPTGSQITSASAKYIQYRINMNTGDTTVTPTVKIDCNNVIQFGYGRAPQVISEPVTYFTKRVDSTTFAYNDSGQLIWKEEADGTKTYYNLLEAPNPVNLENLAIDNSKFSEAANRISQYVLNDTQKTVYIKDSVIISELTAINNVDGSVVEYCQGQISKITLPDGTVITNITFDANNNAQNFTYVKNGVTYIVEDGAINEVVTSLGDDITYNSRGQINAIAGATTDKEFIYGAEAIQEYITSAVFQNGSVSNTTYSSDAYASYLHLSYPLLDVGNGSDGDLVVGSGQNITIDGTKNYKSIYVASGATLTISPWNGSSGGELILKCQGSVMIDGTLTVTGKGLRGGSTIGGQGSYGQEGESIYGVGTGSPAANYGGGGGGRNGIKDVAVGSSGGGGGYATLGGSSSSTGGGGTVGSHGGAVYGDEQFTNFYMGSGGGKGGAWWGNSGCGGTGGNGGGRIKIIGSSVTINGTLSADGQNGGNGTSQGAGGGGGSGGAIWIIGDSVNINGTLSVKGGKGGISYAEGSYAGGDGGNGRIRIDYSTLTINPVINACKKELECAASGTFISEVIQVNALELGKISWGEVLPTGTDVTFQTRTGDTATPDATWSDWSGPLTDSSGSQITSSPKKYIQYKVNMSTADTLVTPKITVNAARAISISYVKFSGNPLDPYVRVKEGGMTSAYNQSGILIWKEDALGNRTNYDPSSPRGTIDISSLTFDQTEMNTLKEAIPTYKLGDAQKVITIYDKGNDIPIEIVNADQSITYFDQGYATKVVDRNGVLQVQYTYDADYNIIKVEFIDARQKLAESYEKAVSEIVTQKDAALAKLAAAESSAEADIKAKAADIQKQIDDERQLLTQEKSKYDPSIYDLSEFDKAFTELDDYQAKLMAQTLAAYTDLASQTAAATARINADASTAMQELIDNDYNKILADIVQKESSPIIYQYYRKVLGRDPGDDELIYWMNKAKADLKPVNPTDITQYLQNLPEYTDRQARKQNIINELTSFLNGYLAASASGKEAMLVSLGISASEAASLTTDDVNAILSWLSGQSLHFGDSAFQTVIAMLKDAGINKSFEDVGAAALKVDILTGVITKDTEGDLIISMYAMRKAAAINGLTLYSEKINYDDLKNQVSSGSVVIHIDGKHYVLVTSIDDAKGTVTYTDTTVGKVGQSMTVSRAELMEVWKGYVLSKTLPGEPAKQINATNEKNIRGSSWWSSFWKGIVSFFQNIIAPVASILMFVPGLQPLAIGLHALNVVIQTVSFIVKTGTLMDIAWAAINAIGSYIGSQVLPNIYNAIGELLKPIGSAVGNIFTSIGNMFTPAAKGMFSAAMDIFNNISNAVQGIATNIGNIFNVTISEAIGKSLVEAVIRTGVNICTDYLFKSIGVDPSLANIGSALLSGAIIGAINPGADIGTSIVSSALKYGTIAGVEELGAAVNLDPNITHLSAMMAGALVGGALEIDGKTISYDDLMKDIAPNILSESAYIGVTDIGDLLGVDPRISYLTGIGIRSSISAGLTGASPSEMWTSISNGLLQGVVNVGLNYTTSGLNLPPLLTNLGFSAISSAINAGIQVATGKSDNFFDSIFKTYTDNALTFLNYGASNNAWQQAAYIAQILDFSNIVRDEGLVEALNTYGASFFNAVAVNNIVQSGLTIGDYFKNKLDLGQGTARTLQDGQQVTQVAVKDAQGNIISNVFFVQKQNGASFYWDIVGKEDLKPDGSYLGWGSLGVDAYGKLGYTDAELYSIFNSDTQFQKIQDGQQTYAEIKDSQGNTLLVIEPTTDGHYNVYNSYGDYVDAKISSILSGKTYSFSNDILKQYQELDVTNTTSLFDVDFSNPDAIGLMFNNLSLSASDINTLNNLTAQDKQQMLNILLFPGIGNPEPIGVSPAYMQAFAQQLAWADPGAVNTTFIATYENSSSLLGKAGNIMSWIGNTYLHTNEVTNYITSEVNLRFANNPPANMVWVDYSGSGDPSIKSANANPSWDVHSIVLVDAPIGFNTNITNPNVKNVIMVTGLDDLLAGPVFTNKFDNNPRPLNTYNIALIGVGHTDFANQNPSNPTAMEVTQFTAYITKLANNKPELENFLNTAEGVTYNSSLKMYEVDLSKVTYGK